MIADIPIFAVPVEVFCPHDKKRGKGIEKSLRLKRTAYDTGTIIKKGKIGEYW